MLWYSPKTWSAKAQALACAVVPMIVAALNLWQKWNLDPQFILGFMGLGGVTAAAVAHIDHGEAPTIEPFAKKSLVDLVAK